MLLVFESHVDNSEKLINTLKERGARAIFDETKAYGTNHVLMALYHTDLAFKNKSNFADDFSLEYLIRLSGEKQISKALKFGIKNGFNRIGIIVDEEKKEDIISILGTPVKPGKYDKDFIIEYFEITDINNQKETEKVIYEKIALLNTKL